MTISNKIKGLLYAHKGTYEELAKALGISTQALRNKFYRDSFSVNDLIRIAEYLNCELSFNFSDGSKTVLSREDLT